MARQDSASEPLPECWEERQDDTLNGRTYYVDCTSGRTQWDRPTRSSKQDTRQRPLPKSWEKRKTADGRTYYVDHISKSTQWDRPTRPLPKSWEKRKTADGRTYYVDHISKSTQWDRPTRSSKQDTRQLTPLPKSWEKRKTADGRTYYVDHISKSTQWDRPTRSSKQDTRQLRPLPKSWEERQDGNGRTYYLDHISRSTQWDRPISYSEQDTRQRKKTEGGTVHDYCCLDHAQKDAPNRDAKILTSMPEVQKFLQKFSDLKVASMKENDHAKPGGALFNTFRSAMMSLPTSQRNTCLAFHGTSESNIDSICSTGYDQKKRSRQVNGAGEYFATSPIIPLDYCNGGKKLLLNELLLGQNGTHHTTHHTKKGDIVVMKNPAHDLPRFVITFK
ncbi:E3 ubiquitin-protein ligase NEDD4-like isoform X2 [Halichondria panicea]|uniref:E3 ubiquitin-protein ligase NEDD4-like isoform X2 n=1 Tax=Halichondria panicea TaxID=6063 RepID=UPI00312B400C